MSDFEQKVALAFLSFGLAVMGYLIVHKLTIKRDRIKEFNELAGPLTKKIDEHLKYVHNTKHTGPWVDPSEFQPLLELFNTIGFRIRLWLFKRRVKKLCYYNESGEWHIKNPKKIASSLIGLKKCIARK
jgi:hypothetical protein